MCVILPRWRRPCLFLWFFALVGEASLRGGGGSSSPFVFVIRSSTASPRAAAQAGRLSKQLVQQGVPSSAIRMLHAEEGGERGEFVHTHGYWTLTPYVPRLHKAGQALGAAWYVFVEPTTAVDVRALRAALAVRAHGDDWFVGHKLMDKSGSITHEYNTAIGYPLDRAGFAVSRGLMAKLAAKFASRGAEGMPRDFHIDATWSFAKHILDETHGKVKITDDAAFCAGSSGASAARLGHPRPGCGTQAVREKFSEWKFSGSELSGKDVIIAVKTTKIFHAVRLPVQKATWIADRPPGMEVVFMSETEDQSVPTIDLTKEWPKLLKVDSETATGHCAKCHALLKTLAKRWPSKKWYVVVDDDTMMSIPRLLDLLRTYDSSKPVYLGQRYAYAHTGGENPQGADYVTMGGGMAMSGTMLKRVLKCEECYCPTPNQPDDMRIGSWVDVEMGLPISHEDGFHQAEMSNYHDEVLASQNIVSFHKFRDLEDAKQGYNKWLLDSHHKEL